MNEKKPYDLLPLILLCAVWADRGLQVLPLGKRPIWCAGLAVIDCAHYLVQHDAVALLHGARASKGTSEHEGLHADPPRCTSVPPSCAQLPKSQLPLLPTAYL